MSQVREAAAAGGRGKALLELVLESNRFQRARAEKLGFEQGAALADLPPLEKRELVADQQRHPPFGTNLTYPLERYTHVHQTSGTIGPPLRVPDTAEDWAWWRRLFADTLTVCGVRPGHRVALAFSFGPHVQFWAARDGLAELGAMSVALGGMTSTQRLQTMADLEVQAVMCTPSYALRLIEVAVEQGLEEALAPIERVICTGEPGASLPAVRARIGEGFDALCFDHAGLTEVGPFGYPCPEGGGLHVYEHDFECEILDADLRPVVPGERGELVLSALRRTGFPVLRYRTGDVVVNAAEPCPGGHADRWLPGGIVGRTDDMVVIRGMNVHPSAIEEAVRAVSGAGEYRITFYSEPSGMDEIKLEVELRHGPAGRHLQELMSRQLGLRVRVVPVLPGTLPRSEGKARRVIDERPTRWGRA